MNNLMDIERQAAVEKLTDWANEPALYPDSFFSALRANWAYQRLLTSISQWSMAR